MLPLVRVALGAVLATPFLAMEPQAPQQPSAAQQFETRAVLEARAIEAARQNRTGEVFLLNSRLQRGDFQEGDRILVLVQNSSRLSAPETLTVREGKRLQLAGMEDLSLEGVLRSELTRRLTEHVERYLRAPIVRATPLVRLAVVGRVNRPGFYYVAADAVISDVLMIAGGPTNDADLRKLEIRRGADLIWNSGATSTALNEGISLDRLHLRAGDEIRVGEARRVSWLAILPTVTSMVALIVSIVR
jgi:hypothetical protein